MNISRPAQLPEARAKTAAFLQERGEGLFRSFIAAGLQPIRPRGTASSPMSAQESAAHLAQAEVKRINDAELFWVDAAMTDLTMAAASSMPPFTLQPEDLPARTGLILFEKPIMEKPSDGPYGGRDFIRAAAWEVVSGAPWDVWISWYTDSAMNLATIDLDAVARVHKISMSAAAKHADRVRLAVPPLSYEMEEMVSFSEAPLPSRSAFTGEVMSKGYYPMRELVTAWTLMQQPIARGEDLAPDRTTRRRLQREGIEPKSVRVIALKRPSSQKAEPSGSGREYHHQWIVRGHWRQQWYPARGVHRPVWIAPHVKGPDDAPLIGGAKVYSWTRS